LVALHRNFVPPGKEFPKWEMNCQKWKFISDTGNTMEKNFQTGNTMERISRPESSRNLLKVPESSRKN